jgi:tetratricopeptide (TPR) repeat protein
MRRSRHSRTSGRQQALGDLFAPDTLEGDPTPRTADASFSLRPFAAEMPQATGVDPHAEAPETPVQRLLRLGREAASAGRPAEAEAAFLELIELDPTDLQGRIGIAQLYEQQGNDEEALRHLGAAVDRHPDLPVALVARGAFLARLKQHPEAEADLRRAIRLAPEDPDAHFELGLALWRKGIAAEAADVLRRAAALDPTRADAEYYLGEAHHQVGRDADALAALERAATLDPGNPKPLHLMGRVLDRLGRPDEAREMYRRAREAGPR